MLTAQLMKSMDVEHLIAAIHAEHNSLTTTPIEEELLRRFEEAVERPDAEVLEGIACHLEEALASLPEEDALQEVIDDARWMFDAKRGRTTLAELRDEARQLAEKLEELQREIAQEAEYAANEIAQAQKSITTHQE